MSKTKQVPVRLEESFYKEVKKKLIDIDRSFNSYVIQLIKEDMKKGDVK